MHLPRTVCNIHTVSIQHGYIRVCDYSQIFPMQNTNRLLNAYFIVYLIHTFMQQMRLMAAYGMSATIDQTHNASRHLSIWTIQISMPLKGVAQQIIRGPKYLCCTTLKVFDQHELDQKDAASFRQQQQKTAIIVECRLRAAPKRVKWSEIRNSNNSLKISNAWMRLIGLMRQKGNIWYMLSQRRVSMHELHVKSF